jgi:apolipoprotein N-acyltransferase
MDNLKMVGIVIFMVMTAFSFAMLLILNKKIKTLLTTTILFCLCTTVLLFSDQAGKFAATFLGNKLSAEFEGIKKNQNDIKIETNNKQDKIAADQKQLSETINKILKIMELENNKPKPLILHSETTLKM